MAQTSATPSCLHECPSQQCRGRKEPTAAYVRLQIITPSGKLMSRSTAS